MSREKIISEVAELLVMGLRFVATSAKEMDESEDVPEIEKSGKSVKGKSGGRKAARVTLDKLKEIMIELDKKYSGGCRPGHRSFNLHHSIWEIRDEYKGLDKDLKKINFDFENFEHEDSGCGFRMIGDIPVLACFAGGDWENPIAFFIYLDPKMKLRAYIPIDGNCFNIDKKSAFGNNGFYDLSDWDEKFDTAHKAFKGCDEDVASRVYGVEIDSDGEVDFQDDKLDMDWKKLDAAFADRVVLA